MDINKKDNNLIVTGLKDFNLHHIFDCGQCFRFNAVSENSYFGIAKNKALLISQNDDEVIFYDTTEDDFKNIWYDYFDLNRDYSEIKSRLSNDPIMKEAVSYGDGIRILNQDLWEAVISFIISAKQQYSANQRHYRKTLRKLRKTNKLYGQNVLHVPRYRYDLFSFKRRFIGYPFRFS